MDICKHVCLCTHIHTHTHTYINEPLGRKLLPWCLSTVFIGFRGVVWAPMSEGVSCIYACMYVYTFVWFLGIHGVYATSMNAHTHTHLMINNRAIFPSNMRIHIHIHTNACMHTHTHTHKHMHTAWSNRETTTFPPSMRNLRSREQVAQA